MGAIRQHGPHLPVLHTESKPEPFVIGARVRLKTCPVGSPGIVQKVQRSRVAVFWPQFDFSGKYRPDRLILEEPNE